MIEATQKCNTTLSVMRVTTGLSRDCPHRDAVQELIAKRKNAGGNSHKSKWKGKGNATAAVAAADANAADKSQTQKAERVGLVAVFLSNEVHIAHAWLCDTVASSTMSGNRSAFRRLTPD